MTQPDDVYVVMVTVPEGEQAETLAATLVTEKLAACVNRIAGVQSIYRWEGKLVKDGEDLLVIKTTRGRFPELQKRILALHPYTVPEILAMPVDAGSAAYLAWVRGEVKP